MLQNKHTFNQSAVNLEIIGIPDFSNNDSKDKISIIDQWKLNIVNKPLIEGRLEHLNSIMDAFYSYTNLYINNENCIYESNLIDITSQEDSSHLVCLKSSKPNTKPLLFNIGNAEISDIISCFDQLRFSNKVIYKYNFLFFNKNNKSIFREYKHKLIRALFVPIIASLSLIIISSPYIFFYQNTLENKEDITLKILKNNKYMTS